MITADYLPKTAQGLRDFIRYAKSEIKKSDFRVKKLNNLIEEAERQLMLLGQPNIPSETQEGQLCQIQAN